MGSGDTSGTSGSSGDGQGSGTGGASSGSGAGTGEGIEADLLGSGGGSVGSGSGSSAGEGTESGSASDGSQSTGTGGANAGAPAGSTHGRDTKAEAIVAASKGSGTPEARAIGLVNAIIKTYYPTKADRISKVIYDPGETGLRTKMVGSGPNTTGEIHVGDDFLTHASTGFARRVLQVGKRSSMLSSNELGWPVNKTKPIVSSWLLRKKLLPLSSLAPAPSRMQPGCV